MANGIAGPPPQTLILEELREQLRGLDQRLRSYHALSRSLIVGAVSAALVAFIAWPDNKPISTPLAFVALLILALLLVMGMIVEDASARWRDGASIDDLVHRYHQAAHMPQAGYLLELALMMTLSTPKPALHQPHEEASRVADVRHLRGRRAPVRCTTRPGGCNVSAWAKPLKLPAPTNTTIFPRSNP